MKLRQLPIIAATGALVAVPALALADHDELALDEAYLYFELNDTDGDLGIHGKADGEAWKRMKIEAPSERNLLNISVRSKLRRQGLTELFFESAEPVFDELEVYLSHIIPEAPVVVSVGGQDENPGFEVDEEGELGKVCWEGVETTAYGGVLIEWEHVDESHFDKWSNPANEPLQNEVKIPLGASGDIEEVIYYEFVAEIDDTDYKATAIIPPAAPGALNSWVVPAEIIALAEEGEIKFEIIVRVESGEGADDDGELVESQPGNQSAVEDCFEI